MVYLKKHRLLFIFVSKFQRKRLNKQIQILLKSYTLFIASKCHFVEVVHFIFATKMSQKVILVTLIKRIQIKKIKSSTGWTFLTGGTIKSILLAWAKLHTADVHQSHQNVLRYFVYEWIKGRFYFTGLCFFVVLFLTRVNVQNTK